MSTLKIYQAADAAVTQTITEHDDIANTLHGLGVSFERWTADAPLEADSDHETIINAYRNPVDRLMKAYQFKSVDVVALTPSHPDKAALRQKFLDEHTHSDFEVRFFVDGKGLFFIHADAFVYGLMCERGDLISVPANTPHWFDMGGEPNFKCIRLFTSPEGWVAQYTGDDIAKRFPAFETF